MKKIFLKGVPYVDPRKHQDEQPHLEKMRLL